MGTRRAHPGTLPTPQRIQKCKHTPLVIRSHPTNPDPSTQADTPAPHRSTHGHVQSHTATSSLQKPTHRPVASSTHSCTHIHITFIHRHAQAEAQSYQHLQTHTHTHTHTHTLSEMLSDAEKHTYGCTNLQELHRHTAYLKESCEYLLSHAFTVIHASIQHVWAPSRCQAPF